MEACMNKNAFNNFKKIIEIVNEMGEYLSITCTKSGMEMSILAPDHIAMASVQLNGELFFDSYRVTEEVILIHAHLVELYKILKNSALIKGWDVIHCKLDKPDSNIITFKLSKAHTTFKMKLLDIQGQSLVDIDNHLESFDYETQLSAKDFANVCSVVGDFSSEMEMTFHRNQTRFRSVDEQGISEICRKFQLKNESPVLIKKRFAITYLKKFSQMSTLSQTVTFGFVLNDISNSPLLLTYTSEDGGSNVDCCFRSLFLLAAKI